MARLATEIDTPSAPAREGESTEGHFKNLKMIPNPPELERWRKKLFDVDDLITMTEDEYARFSCF
jgi:hypothetical protein